MAERGRMSKYRLPILAGGILWLIWLCSILPLVAILYEFGNLSLEKCGNAAHYFAKFYSHMFIYPASFGLLSTIFLTCPFVQTVRYLSHSSRRPIAYIILALMFVVISFASFAEYRGSSLAIWSFTPATLSKIDKGKALNYFEVQCGNRKAGEQQQETAEQEKDNIESALSGLYDNKLAITSWTHIAYSVGFVAIGVQFLTMFGTIIALRIWGSLGNGMVTLVTLALFTATSWTLARIAFISEKLQVYTKEPLLAENLFIFLLFGSLYVTLASSVWQKIMAYERFVHLLIALLGLAAALIPVLVTFLPDSESDWASRILVELFGTQSSLLDYSAMILFVLMVSLPYILLTFKNQLTNDGT